MIGRDYEHYLQSTATNNKPCFDFRFWLVVTGLGFILPLAGFILRG